MKKYFNFAFASAIALIGTCGFTACSSSEDAAEVAQVPDNPTYDPVGKTVTTKFVLNVSSAANNNTTRQSADIVQKNANFRGMKDATLVGLATGVTSDANGYAPFAGGTTTLDWAAESGIKSKLYDLGTLYGVNAVSNTGTNNAENSSHRVVELTLPLTTDAMIVYGRAIPDNDDEENGKVVYNVAPEGKVENTTFDLISRLGDNSTTYVHTCNLAAVILNRIMLSEVSARSAGSDPYSHNGYTQSATLPALSWRTLGAASGTLKPLQENLSKLFKAATGFSTSTTAIRSGSSGAILDMVRDIYATVLTTYNASSTHDDELNAQRLAYDIKTRIEHYFLVTGTNITGFNTLGVYSSESGKYNEGSIYRALCDNAGYTNASIESNFGGVTNATIGEFPSVFKLPEGVSQLFFTAYSANTGAATGGFSYTNPSQSLIDISQTLDPSKYMYPSELLYFDNSLLRVNDKDVEVADYPNGYNTWDAAGSWNSNWSVGKVTSTTRSVAVKNNINYGVSMLQSSVALKSGVTEFQDNRNEIVPTEANQKLSISQVSGFKLTGILIGGQYKKLGWNYIAKSGVATNDNYVIYDNKIVNSGIIPTTTNNENYTLVFDNYKATGDQEDVLVALEFQNGNETDFYGVGGVITKGSTFYLVGKLQLSSATGTDTFQWPTYYAIPPYTSGVTTQTHRVFIQDYMTTATFTIGAESLQKAYSTVPDLRASQTSLGLSVDLNWRPGLSFNVDL